jgi:hypothetical protein
MRMGDVSTQFYNIQLSQELKNDLVMVVYRLIILKKWEKNSAYENDKSNDNYKFNQAQTVYFFQQITPPLFGGSKCYFFLRINKRSTGMLMPPNNKILFCIKNPITTAVMPKVDTIIIVQSALIITCSDNVSENFRYFIGMMYDPMKTKKAIAISENII